MKFDNKNKPLIFAHLGDLHITKAGEQNYKDFLAITAQLAVEAGEHLDFVVLPGDNADNGLAAQYRLISPVLKMLPVPVHILTGDHDMEQGSLDNFYSELQTRKLPYRENIKGINCIFLDVCGPGTGGPDFQLGDRQLEDLQDVLKECASSGPCVIFMHTYPDDLKSEAEKKELLRIINECNVVLVDMGHTHYNELANNGATVYSAVRSTGQIEEGPAGYAITSIDHDVVSWRFKLLADPFPFVMITYPADHRLYRKGNDRKETQTQIRATVIGDTPVEKVTCFVDGAKSVMMEFDGDREDWFTTIKLPAKPTVKICVEAVTIEGRPGRHQIEIATGMYKPIFNGRDGSDELSIGSWTENGIMGTQLGPNRNAKPPKKDKNKVTTSQLGQINSKIIL